MAQIDTPTKVTVIRHLIKQKCFFLLFSNQNACGNCLISEKPFTYKPQTRNTLNTKTHQFNTESDLRPTFCQVPSYMLLVKKCRHIFMDCA